MSKDSRENMLLLGGIAVFAVAAGIVAFFSNKEKMETIRVTVSNGWYNTTVKAIHVTHTEDGVVAHSLYCEHNDTEINIENFDSLYEAIETLNSIVSKGM